MAQRRVVVTGMGVQSPVGADADAVWESLAAGRSGIAPITLFDAGAFAVRIAGEVDGFDGAARFGKRRARHLDRFTQLGLAAAEEALASSGLIDGDGLVAGVDGTRVGVLFASGIGGLSTLIDNVATLNERGPQWVSPYMAPMMIPNIAAGEIAMAWGLRGHNSCPVTACAASAHAVGDAFDLVRWGRVDAVLAGGAEASVLPIGVAGFAAMKALSERNDEPERASRPFDEGRDGFVIAEGAAALVVESLDHALARGAVPIAEVIGYGANADAHHLTAPHPEGDGAVRCMHLALEDAAVPAGAVGYINAHGTSTPANDRLEALAIRRVFGDAAGPAVSSTKSMTGHLLGAAGAFEAFATVSALRHGLLPPTINLERPDPACDLDHVACTARPAEVEVALSNSFGFGGHNATLAFRRWN